MIKKLLNIITQSETEVPSFDDLPYNKDIGKLILFLKNKLPDAATAKKQHESVDQYFALSYKEKITQLPAIYLLLEQYLTSIEDRKTFSRQTLRSLIGEKYESLLEIEGFRLLFIEKNQQELHLAKLFLQGVLEDVKEVAGKANNNFIERAQSWINGLPRIIDPFLLFEDFSFDAELPSSFFLKISQEASNSVESKMGADYVFNIFRKNYDALGNIYKLLETFPFVISIIPQKFLDGDKISILTKHQLSQTLLEKVKSLEVVNAQLAQRNQAYKESRQEVALKSREADYNAQLLAEVMDAVKEGIITADQNSTIIMVNKEAETIFGYESGEMIGMPIAEIMPMDYRSMHHKGMSRFMETRQSRIMKKNVIVEGLRKNGNTFPLELNISNLELYGKDYFTAAVRDITERTELEKELRSYNLKLEKIVEERTYDLEKTKQDLEKKVAAQNIDLKLAKAKLEKYVTKLQASNQELEQFAYIASHDLQEPLRTVASYVQLIKRKFPEQTDSEMNEYIDYAVSGVKRMQSLIKDLLEFSRLEKKQVGLTYFLISNVIDKVKHLLAQRIQNNNASILLLNDIQIQADQSQIIQLFLNIITNAIKFKKADTPPIIQIDVQENDEAYSIHIKDNGIGIDKEFHEKIFVIFQRLHSIGDYEGTGIGLAICKKIVDRHGGKIWVNSQLQEGAEFCFTISKKLEAKHS